MTASIGIWAQSDLAGDVVLYRWQADDRAGFVTFEVTDQRIRPADQSGQPIGDLKYDLATGEASGTAAGVDRQLFAQVVASTMRAYRRLGSAPNTAHAYYY